MKIRPKSAAILFSFISALALVTACGGEEELPATPDSGSFCSACGSAIPFNTPYHSITLGQERRDRDGVTVLEAEALIVLCETCARTRDLTYGMTVRSLATDREVCLDDLQNVGSDTCWECGRELGSEPYFCLVHYQEKILPEMEIEVIEAMDVLYLCPTCRRKYFFESLKLRQAS